MQQLPANRYFRPHCRLRTLSKAEYSLSLQYSSGSYWEQGRCPERIATNPITHSVITTANFLMIMSYTSSTIALLASIDAVYCTSLPSSNQLALPTFPRTAHLRFALAYAPTGGARAECSRLSTRRVQRGITSCISSPVTASMSLLRPSLVRTY